MGEELKTLTLVDLRDLAKQKDIKNISKMNKEELIAAILEVSKPKKENVEVRDARLAQNQAEPLQPGDYTVEGVLEVLPDGFGFLRGENYLSTPKDIYVSPVQIKRFRLGTGDKINGIARSPKESEKFSALIYISTINGGTPEQAIKRKNFDDLTPIYPNRRIHLETTEKELRRHEQNSI